MFRWKNNTPVQEMIHYLPSPPDHLPDQSAHFIPE